MRDTGERTTGEPSLNPLNAMPNAYMSRAARTRKRERMRLYINRERNRLTRAVRL